MLEIDSRAEHVQLMCHLHLICQVTSEQCCTIAMSQNTVAINKRLTFHFIKMIVLTFMRYRFSTMQNDRHECMCTSASVHEHNPISDHPRKMVTPCSGCVLLNCEKDGLLRVQETACACSHLTRPQSLQSPRNSRKRDWIDFEESRVRKILKGDSRNKINHLKTDTTKRQPTYLLWRRVTRYLCMIL